MSQEKFYRCNAHVDHCEDARQDHGIANELALSAWVVGQLADQKGRLQAQENF